ncbi:hypothetical protein COO91_04401 [Nostoc flagelliforme CCNUN1]|uniref:Uncharacterized protein n=1 Tax=Nostoc flagelliforme CCNUN1 TaxID=2038116 RepID=A0A2K8SSN2_9NOSO|nr:hypothetical protein COO91_04401 [Nostoc flagelliforme CCNUN1]
MLLFDEFFVLINLYINTVFSIYFIQKIYYIIYENRLLIVSNYIRIYV